MDKAKAAAHIVAKALPLVPFDGWSLRALQQAAIDAGYQAADVARVFPGGPIEAVNRFSRGGDEEMLRLLRKEPLDAMKIRERIAAAIRVRLSLHDGHPEALRRALALQSLPFYAWQGLKNLYATVDAIWHAAGDASTDFSFYTRRLTLAGVYSATALYWLGDGSPGHADTWAFLDRRIHDVMQIEKFKSRSRQWMAGLSARMNA